MVEEAVKPIIIELDKEELKLFIQKLRLIGWGYPLAWDWVSDGVSLYDQFTGKHVAHFGVKK